MGPMFALGHVYVLCSEYGSCELVALLKMDGRT